MGFLVELLDMYATADGAIHYLPESIKTLILEIESHQPSLQELDYFYLKSIYTVLLQRLFPQVQDRQFWAETMIISWINTNNVDLDSENELIFDDFIMGVIQQDFDKDGRNEWILDITN